MKKVKTSTSPLLDKLMGNLNLNQEFKYEQNWESLVSIYTAVAQSIVAIGTEVNNAIRTINALGVVDNAELTISVNGLRKDIEQYATDLITIRSRHENRSGRIKDGNELALLISIFEDYTGMQERIQANAFPVLLTVTEHMSAAVVNKKQQDEQTAILDPQVVTDVEVKEIL